MDGICNTYPWLILMEGGREKRFGSLEGGKGGREGREGRKEGMET